MIVLPMEVPVPTETLPGYLPNLENDPAWNWGVKSVTTKKSGDPAEGVRFSQERASGGADTDLLETTRHEPDGHLEIIGTIGEGQVTYHHHLTRLSSDSTRPCISIALLPSTPMVDFYTARLGAAVSANLEILKARFEDTASSSGDW